MKSAAVPKLAACLTLTCIGGLAAADEPTSPPAPPLRAAITDSVVHDAIRDTLAKTPGKAPPQERSALSGGDKYREFARQLDKAVVPYCFGPDALKHQPTTFELGGWEIGIGHEVNNLLAKPFILIAAARGKCQ